MTLKAHCSQIPAQHHCSICTLFYRMTLDMTILLYSKMSCNGDQFVSLIWCRAITIAILSNHRLCPHETWHSDIHWHEIYITWTLLTPSICEPPQRTWSNIHCPSLTSAFYICNNIVYSKHLTSVQRFLFLSTISISVLVLLHNLRNMVRG